MVQTKIIVPTFRSKSCQHT